MKRFIYLISPNKVDQSFYVSLDRVLSFKNVKFFQIRLKNVSQKKLHNISKKIKKVTIKHKVKFNLLIIGYGEEKNNLIIIINL